jgi:hypothetical protein
VEVQVLHQLFKSSKGLFKILAYVEQRSHDVLLMSYINQNTLDLIFKKQAILVSNLEKSNKNVSQEFKA